MRVNKILLLLLLATFSFSKEISLDFLNSKPKSIYKDYYIWRFLDKNVSSDTAFKLIGDVKNMNRKLFLKFCKRVDKPIYKKIAKCYKMYPKEFLKADVDCIRIGFSVYDATKLSKKDLKTIQDRVLKRYPKFAEDFDIFLAKDPFKALVHSNNRIFFDVFDRVGSKYREKHFNKPIPKKRVNKLIDNSRFNYAVKLIVTDLKLTKLQKSILNIDSSKLKAKTNFLLAMNAIRHDKKKLALRYLDIAFDKYKYRFDKDKALFWKYLITKDVNTLYELSNSFDANIYTIYALQKLRGKKFLDSLRIVSDIECKNIPPKIDIEDPFDWLGVLDRLNKKDANATKIANSFKSCQELPYKAFALERADFKTNYFIVPYKQYLDEYPKQREILMLSIARQESRFIPSSISYSYALGMMQFMPFLVRATAKQMKLKNFDLDDIFDPKNAYIFADKHLNYLESRLKHPLLIAYAYNGGIGFTRRMLKKELFKKGRYEPYLSMELVPYDESKRYAKKVVANYIIYSSLYGKYIDIKTLFQSLVKP